jgi:hypothetical protein
MLHGVSQCHANYESFGQTRDARGAWWLDKTAVITFDRILYVEMKVSRWWEKTVMMPSPIKNEMSGG